MGQNSLKEIFGIFAGILFFWWPGISALVGLFFGSIEWFLVGIFIQVIWLFLAVGIMFEACQNHS
jgi:hypothetical protein